MNNYQEIQLNVGLNYTDENGKTGEFDRELGRFLTEVKFKHCGIISEPYQSRWNCEKTGVTYLDNCLAFKVSVSKPHAMTVQVIRTIAYELAILLKQDAIAYCVETGDSTHSEMVYADENASDKLEFDPRYFHYVN
jgi:hypothetical protein